MNALPDEIKAKMNKRGLSHKEKNARKRKALDIEDIPPSGWKEHMLRYRFILPVAYGIVAFVILFDIVRILDFSDTTANILESIVKFSNDGKLYL